MKKPLSDVVKELWADFEYSIANGVPEEFARKQLRARVNEITDEMAKEVVLCDSLKKAA